MKFVDDILEGFRLPVPVDQFKLGLLLVLDIPFGLILRKSKNTALKHRISYITGIWNLFFLYEAKQVIQSIILNIAFYFAIKKFPHRYRLFVVLSFGYLVCYHIYRMFVDYLGWKIDFSTFVMMNCVKLMSFAFNVHDGLVDEDKLSPHAKTYRILPSEFPTLAEFLGHTFFFVGLCVGPDQEYKDHMAFMTFKRFEKVGGVVPTDLWAIFSATMKMIIYGAISILSPFDTNFYRRLIYSTDKSLVKKVLLTYVFAISARTRYYLGWSMPEALATVVGCAARVRPEDNKVVWDQFKNFDYFKIEFPNSIKQLLDNWNIAIQHWLRYYVYERLAGTKLDYVKAYVTFAMSAFWHGFYPAYYIMFAVMAVHRTVSNITRHKLRATFLKHMSQKHYDMLTTVFTCISSPNACLFTLLTFKDSVMALKNVMWTFNLPIVLWGVVVCFIPSPKKEANNTKKEGASQTKKEL